jgi:DNA-binding transcriptional ArsR family regulator
MTDRVDSSHSCHRHRRQARLFRALGNESRLTMLERLRRGECCVCDLAELTRLDQSTVSRHLSLLSDAGAVEGERRGNHVYYRLAADWVAELLDRGAARAGPEEEASEPQS